MANPASLTDNIHGTHVNWAESYLSPDSFDDNCRFKPHIHLQYRINPGVFATYSVLLQHLWYFFKVFVGEACSSVFSKAFITFTLIKIE